MTSVFSETNEVLQQLWKQHNPQEDEYLEKDKVVQWIKVSLQKTNTLESVGDSLLNVQGLIKQYLIQVHEVNEDQMQNIALNYSEAVGFLRWLTQTDNKEQEKKEQEKNPQPEQQVQPKNQEIQLQDKELEQKIKEQTHQDMKNSSHKVQVQHSNSSPKLNNSSKYEKRQHSGSRVIERSSPDIPSPKKIKTDFDKYQEDANQNETVNPNEFNLEQISKKYKDYLRIIFEHYCKISYATGNDPTFEQIKHKTTIMTINKFMMFCKDFEISKVAPNINRNFLVEIFKKNSECYKEMSFQQFCEVIKKLANLGFSQGPQHKNQKEQTQLLSNQMVKMLQFMDISTAKKYRQKLKRLNIQYRAGPKTNAEMKVVPQGYRFKFTTNNGKSQQQVKQELVQRKQHRSQRKILLQEKINNQQIDPLDYRKRVLSKRTDRMNSKQRQLAPIREANIQSTHALNKILSPPVPPVRRQANMPPNIPKSNSQTPSLSQQPSSNPSQNNTANIFKRQMGYAELHKIKQSQGYGKKKMIVNSLNKSNSRESNFRLNSIVEQARNQVMERPKEGYSDMTDSIGTNSREEANRSKNYDINKINNKIQLINQKNRRQRQIQEQLTDILDMSNDEDEFLRQHLEREQKHEFMNKRLSNRINQLDRGL